MSLLFCTYKQSYQWRLIKITFRCRKIENLYIKIHLLPTNIIVSLEPCPLSPIFWCFRSGSGIKSVSGEDSSLKLPRLEPTTRSTTSLCESVSTSESDEVACCLIFLSGGCRGCWRSIELYGKPPMCGLIIATFSAFFPLKVILWWEKYKDSSSTLTDDSFAYRSCTVQPSQCHCTAGSAVPFDSFQSPLSFSPCAFLSGQGAQHTLPLAFRG